MGETNNKSECDAVEKILKEPIFIGLDEKAIKTRNSLIGFSSFALFYTLGELTIKSTEGYSVFGLSLSGVSDEKVKIFLLIIVSYFLIHFLWSAWDTFLEWRLRITGTKASFITTATFDMDTVDNINDPRQCTITGWWWNQQRTFEYHRAKKNPNQSEDQALTSAYSSLEKVLSDKRLLCSLQRFEKWLLRFHNSQNWRWFIFELLFPFLLGVSALYFLLKEIL